MGFFYIDESVHDEAGFIIAACTYFETDPSAQIKAAIQNNGFAPDNFEFKSGFRYANAPDRERLRDELRALLSECKLGIVVVPRAAREMLGNECLKALKQFIELNERIKEPIEIYFDENIFRSCNDAKKKSRVLLFPESISFQFEQDSKLIRGIQIADLAAHTASIYFKERLGLLKKYIKAGDNSGYHPEMQMELGFGMWAMLRYCFFSKKLDMMIDDPISDATQSVSPFGLYISELCNEELKEKAEEAFGSVYLGCIH